MSNVQQIESLYTWFKDHDDDIRPGYWEAHPIIKRTKEFVFVQYRIGKHYRENLRLRRHELESKGEIYWVRGTLVRCFYTEEKKNRIDEHYKTRNTSECLKALGLTSQATADDVKRAYPEAALKFHPDAGGSHEGFLRLKEDYESALRMFR